MKHQILITDDDVDDTEVLTDALMHKTFEGDISIFRNGKELIDFINETEGVEDALIILDLNMPGMDGYETLKYLKVDSKWHKMKIIVFTSSTNMSDKKLCMKLGCENYLNKPDSLSGYEETAQKIIEFIG